MTDHTPELAARAAEQHVVVIGGGIGGLVAARECAKVGMSVTLLEASEQLGGAIRRAEVEGLVVDAGAESYATRGGHVRALVTELGLGGSIVTPEGGGAWIDGIPGVGAAPIPKGGMLGIPENPFQEGVRRVIGTRGVWRAYVDRLRPPLTIGHEKSLGKLVATRMGERVRDRLVAPVTAGVYSAHPDDVDVEAVAPGLSAALTRAGSLSGAVALLRADREEKGKAPGSAVEGLVGGMSTLVDALRADLEDLGVRIRTGVHAEQLTRDGKAWTVRGESFAEDDESATEELRADAVIVATSEPAARTLLTGHADLGAPAVAPEIEIVTLVLDAPELDAAPRGTGVLTVPGSRVAKALTHSTVKWGWLREAAAGRHVVRVSFGSQGETPATAALDDADAAQLALAEASAMLGMTLRPEQLVGAHRARHVQAQPASVIGSAQRRTAARAAVRAVPGVAAVGAWLAGTGLAQVVPDAVSETDRLRRALLFG
ncbi:MULTISPECIES: NAD(P)/FAD-dependent oxidoreductase [unclassified Microbacterium]|uniref:protoporphyrinogen/coproporphyrinogen oxidase n=1 Tax=unclassified Microbacterium TaxID=2609290 RepID=UPI0012FB9854|nr:FAD-dependent oxidoreductase [Microbacterium sp. MAH-37]MVQ43652.1 NAD(P)-binding protein [Microbacterium sp. MAH-37]